MAGSSCNNGAIKRGPTEESIREKFWSVVNKDGPLPGLAAGVNSKCWLWLGSLTDQGYGRFKANGKTHQVYRYAPRENGKPAPESLTVSTRSGNKLCVRHLYTRSRGEIIVSIQRL